MISYAHNREDVLLARIFPEQQEGFYIDVGANQPVACSVTKHFSELGWRGVNVEPSPALHAMLQADRPRDVNLNVGLSEKAGTLTFYESPGRTSGLSTFSATEAAIHRGAGIEFQERQVEVTTLADLCARHATGTIDFLSIDVEGHERQVLLGADFSRFRPRVLLLEAVRPNVQVPCHEDWEDLVLGADYLFAAFDGVNRYYVRAEEAELLPRLRYPVSAFDRYEPYEYVARIDALRQEAEALRASLALTEQALEKEWARYAELETRHIAVADRAGLGDGALRAAQQLDRLYGRFARARTAAGRALRALSPGHRSGRPR